MADDGKADDAAGTQDDGTQDTVYTQAEVDQQVAGLKAKLSALLGKNKKLAELAKTFEGLDPDEVRGLLERSKHGDGKPADPPPDLEKYRLKVEAEVSQRYKPIEDELTTTKAELRRLKVDDRVKAAALAAGVRAAAVDDALRVTRDVFDLDEKGRVIVLDEDGDPSAVTLDRYFSETLKSAKPWFYEGSGASGSGTGSGRGEGKPKAIPAAAMMDHLEAVAKGEVTVQ